MRVGLFGGSFNPPHNAHIQLCEFARKAAFLDKIILIPTGDNPLKKTDETIPRKHRMAMTVLAFRHLSEYEVSDIEIMRSGQSFTIDTVKYLRSQSNDEFFFVSGSDILFQLTKWKDFHELAHLISFVVLARKGVDNERLIEEAERLNRSFGATVILIENSQPDEISSSSIRTMMLEGQDISALVPLELDKYIKKNHLYRTGTLL